MSNLPFLAKITIDPAICNGKPCIGTLAHPIDLFLELFQRGMSLDEVLAMYPDVTHQELLAVQAVQELEQVVDDLKVAHRAKESLRTLMAAGPLSTPAVRRGLRHPEAVVRVGCCQVLDHFMDEGALPELIENLSHPDPEVRSWAMHALACDRCKEGACRPGEDDVIPIATRMLLDDEDRVVRQRAAGLLGPSVHRRPDVLKALVHAADHDPHPVVRKIARWFIPGGPRYERLAPKPPKRRKLAA